MQRLKGDAKGQKLTIKLHDVIVYIIVGLTYMHKIKINQIGNLGRKKLVYLAWNDPPH